MSLTSGSRRLDTLTKSRRGEPRLHPWTPSRSGRKFGNSAKSRRGEVWPFTLGFRQFSEWNLAKSRRGERYLSPLGCITQRVEHNSGPRCHNARGCASCDLRCGASGGQIHVNSMSGKYNMLRVRSRLLPLSMALAAAKGGKLTPAATFAILEKNIKRKSAPQKTIRCVCGSGSSVGRPLLIHWLCSALTSDLSRLNRRYCE